MASEYSPEAFKRAHSPPYLLPWNPAQPGLRDSPRKGWKTPKCGQGKGAVQWWLGLPCAELGWQGGTASAPRAPQHPAQLSPALGCAVTAHDEAAHVCTQVCLSKVVTKTSTSEERSAPLLVNIVQLSGVFYI